MKIHWWVIHCQLLPVRGGPRCTTITPASLSVQLEQIFNLAYSVYKVNECFCVQDALTLLAENAELNNEDGRAVAFRRAAAVLKALPGKVTSVAELKGLPCLGEHSQRVIKVIIIIIY